MIKNKIFIACDTTNISKVKKIISKTQNSKIKVGYKFGLEFLNSKSGRPFLSKLKNKIKFVDIQKNLFKLIKKKEFMKYKRRQPKNVDEIIKLNNYVRFKILKNVYKS